MNLEQFYYAGELVGVVAIFGSLIFVGMQMRQSNRVNSAAAKQAISEQALQLISFQANHADRIVKVAHDRNPTDGDKLFLESYHRMIFQLAETYHLNYHLGLMPEDHWSGFAKFMEDTAQGYHVRRFWEKLREHYGNDFVEWIDGFISAPPQAGQADPLAMP